MRLAQSMRTIRAIVPPFRGVAILPRPARSSIRNHRIGVQTG
jgi:hypothetical protein